MNQHKHIPRIESLRIKNYRVLHDLEIGPLTAFTVFIGPNGSGKSTLFDLLAFLSESFSEGLRKAWLRRGRFGELRTRGASGPISIELTYREQQHSPPLTYHLTFDEEPQGPVVVEEWLQKVTPSGSTELLLNFTKGTGWVVNGSQGNEGHQPERLNSREILAVSVFGQLANYPRISALRDFVTGWHISLLSILGFRETSAANGGLQEQLSTTGDNLPNVLRYLEEQHPARLVSILATLSRYVPQLERVETVHTLSGQLQLQLKDTPFSQTIPSRFISQGTLNLLAYLMLLNEPHLPPLIALEEPENHIHPYLLPYLADECCKTANKSQLLVTTHSPSFVNSLDAEDLWVLYRNAQGFTQARRTADMRGIKSFMEHGEQLGALWKARYFEVGDPRWITHQSL